MVSSGVQSKGDGASNYQLSGLPAALDAAMLLSHFSEPVRDRRRVDQGSARSRTCAPLVLDRLYRPRSAPLRGSAGRRISAGPNQLEAFTRGGMGPCEGRDQQTGDCSDRCRHARQTDYRGRHLAAACPIQGDHRRRSRRPNPCRQRLDPSPSCFHQTGPTGWVRPSRGHRSRLNFTIAHGPTLRIVERVEPRPSCAWVTNL